MKECPLCLECFADQAEECPRDASRLEQALEGEPVIDGKYRLEKRLGRGGMGIVYRARHLGLDRPFALKLIRFPHSPIAGGRSFADRFRIEATALGRLRHAGIVQVSDYGVDPRGAGLPYLVMELLEGETLRDFLAAGPLSLDRALPLLEAAAQATDYAHASGVLHRDLKPGNVFVARDPGGGETVKLLDFGLARLVELTEAAAARDTAPIESVHAEDETHRDAFPGTAAYMAPELAKSEPATPASDIYSFGVLAYELLSGKPPFGGRPAQVLWGHVAAAPPAPSTVRPSLPPELDEALLSALEKEPGRRPGRAADVVAALRSAALRAKARAWRAREIPRRLGLAALLSPLLVALSASLEHLSLLQDLERRTVDLRFAVQPRRSPDPRILLLSVDDASLAADATPLAERADEFGRELAGVFDAGARGVAIDFLLPKQWNRSEAFSSLVLGRFESLTLAAFSAPSGETIGMECIEGLTAAALGPSAISRLFGFVNLDEDPDGVTRRARLFYLDRDGGTRDSLAGRSARALAGGEAVATATPTDSFWIDYSVDWDRFPKVSWKDLRSIADRGPALFSGRLVLVGGSFVASGDDYHRVPRTATTRAVSGLVLQAVMVDTILRGAPIREADALPRFAGVGGACALLFAASLCLRRPAAVGLFLALAILQATASLLAFRWASILLPVATPFATLAVALGLAILLRSKLPRFPGLETVPQPW